MPKAKCATQSKAEAMKDWLAEAKQKLEDVRGLCPEEKAWVARCMKVAIEAIESAESTFEV